MQLKTWLLDIAALDASDNPVTLRFASSGYIDGNNNFYAPRLLQPALYTVKAFGQIIAGASRSGYGEATLINIDGKLNYLADYACDGRLVTVRLVDTDGTVSQILRGTASKLSFDDTKVSVRLRDPQIILQTPHPLNTYAGTNVLPDGVEGVTEDIQGKSKPRAYGIVSNAAPVLVNTALYVYQFHDGPGADATAVKDRGIALGRGANYVDMADMMANAPVAGQYRVFQGYFRVGQVPTGQVTVDITCLTTKLGDVFVQLATERGATVNLDDVAALNAVGDVGIYLNGARNTTDLLDLLANSAGGFWANDSSGQIRISQLKTPAQPVAVLQDYQIKTITRSGTGAGDNGLPVWSVTFNADRIETTQTDLASGVPAEMKSRLAAQTRQSVATVPATLTRHPLADQLTVDTALVNLADANTQTQRVVTLLSSRRDAVQVTAEINSTIAALMSIGTTITVKTSRLGYGAGRDLIVTGYTPDASLSRVTLDLWG